MRGNTITMHLARGKVSQTGSLFQYDYGQKLIFAGVELPQSYEVHFSNQPQGNCKTMLGDATGVEIPDEYLTSGENIHVFVYLHNGEDDGETEYHGIVNVQKRGKPTDQQPTPEQQTIIEQAISALESAVESIPGEIDEALAEAKSSGEFDGKDGKDGKDGQDGAPGRDGIDGKDGADGAPGRDGIDGKDGAPGKDGADGAPGQDGQDGAPGEDGYSPTVSVSDITGGHRVTVTDAQGTHIFDVMDGQNGAVQDVQINGSSILLNGVANIPATDGTHPGVVNVQSGSGLSIKNGVNLSVNMANLASIKTGTNADSFLRPSLQDASAFYGLAKAAGNSDQSSSANAVGTYTADALVKIQKMLGLQNTQWELINEVTTTQDMTELIVDTDSNGEPFELTRLIAVFDALAPTTGTRDSFYGQMYGFKKGQSTIACDSFPSITYPSATSVLKSKIEIDTNGGNAPVRQEIVTGTSDGNSQNKVAMPKEVIFTNITKIRIYQSASNKSLIPSGSTLKLYGIRKW